MARVAVSTEGDEVALDIIWVENDVEKSYGTYLRPFEVHKLINDLQRELRTMEVRSFGLDEDDCDWCGAVAASCGPVDCAGS